MAEALMFLFSLYVGMGFVVGLQAFVFCGLPEIRARRVLDDPTVPRWLHAAYAVFIATLVALSWPWYLWQVLRK